MQKFLLQDDVKHVEDKIKQFEANTGCELLIVVAKSSDEYPGATWRFGMMTGFIATFIFSLFFEFHHGYFWPLLMLVLSILAVFVGKYPWAKRLAMSDIELQRETQEKALELFHTIGTSQVAHKVTAMIMISLFEKKIIVLVDEKLKKEITQAELDELVIIMQPHFKAGNMGLGLIESIQSLEQKILQDFGGKVSDSTPSELKDTIHFL